MSIDKIKANAELVIKELSPLSGPEFGYNPESVAWVDGFIEEQRIRTDTNEQVINGFVNTLGSFLGECIIQCHGGFWQNIAGEWCVSFVEENAAFPFTKVRKQFINGHSDSIKAFFLTIPTLFKDYIQLWRYIQQVEDAYTRLYDERSSSGRAGLYNECKESTAEAVNLARRLGLNSKAEELDKRCDHIKSVFRNQMGF